MTSLENAFLAEQIALLDRVLAASLDHIYVIDRAGRYQYASPAGLAALGLQASDILGKTWRQLNFPASVMERLEAQQASVFQSGVPVQGETHFPTVNGVRYYEYVFSPVLGQAGAIEAMVSTVRDITDRKQAAEALRSLTAELEARVSARTAELTAINQSLRSEIVERQKAEQALQESEGRFNALVEAMFEGVVMQENGKIIEANSGFATLFGYTLEEVMGKSAADFLTPESLERVLKHTADQDEEPYELTGIRQDGTLITLEVVGKQSLYQGRPIRISAARDITERKRAENALRAKEQQLQQLSDLMPQFVWISNAEGETEYVNRQWLDYSGLTAEAARQPENAAALLHPEDAPAVSQHWAIARANQQPFELEARLQRAADGAYRWFLMRSTPVLDEQGQVMRWYGTSTDIHDRKVTQLNHEFVNELDLRLRSLVDAEAMVWEAISAVGEYLHVDRCVWREVNVAEDRGIVTQDWRRQVDIASLVGVSRLSAAMVPEMIAQYQAGQPVVVPDVTTHPDTVPLVETFIEQGIRAFVGVPCLYEGRWVALLAINASTEQAWQPHQVALLQEIVARLWPLIDQTRAVKALQEQEERTRLATEAAALGMWFWDIPQNELVWTDRCKALFGLPLDTPISYDVFLNALHPDDRDFAQAAVTRTLAQQGNYNIEYRTCWPDGSIRWLAARGQAWFDADDQPIRMMGTVQDISDRKQAEQELQAVYDSLNLALAAAEMGTWDLDLRSDRARRNLRHDQIFGYDTLQPEWGHAMAKRHALPEDLPKFEEGFQRGLNTGELQFEARIIWPDQSRHWINVMGRVYYDDQRHPVRMAGIVMDITERKQAEAKLRKTEDLYRAIAHNFPNGAVHIFDHDLRYLLSDGEEMRRLGLSRAQLEGFTPWEALPPETSAALEPSYRAALAGETTTTELTFADQIYQIYTLPLRHESGAIYAGLSISQNVTLLKQAEQTLRTARDELERQVQARTRELWQANIMLAQREREFRTLVENTPDVITRHDRQHRCLYINPASLRSLGLPPDFFIGKQPSELGYPEELAQFWHTSLESVFVTGQMRIDEFTVMGDQGPLNYQVYVVPEKDADQSMTSVMTIGRDVTQLRQSEQAARQLAEELQRSNQELEQFAYVASHDLQEPLRAITSFTQLLAKRYQDHLDDKANTYIEFIVDGATRMQQLIRDLLTYSRAGRYELKRQPVDCNALLERVQKDLQITIAENRATITADPLPTVTADPTQLGNVLQNLISNALKYRREIPPEIHIAARQDLLKSRGNDASGTSNSSIPTLEVPEAWVFSIQDNGIGIEPQYSERIFGIFQRLHTRDEYSGTGLGLAICQKIIERHGGHIWVESQPGQGTTFFFTIPILTPVHYENSSQAASNSAS